MSLGSILKHLQLFVYAFSFAVFSCMGVAMMAGRLDGNHAMGWMAENLVRHALADPNVRDRYFRGRSANHFDDIGAALGASDREMSSLDQLRFRQRAEIAAKSVQGSQ